MAEGGYDPTDTTEETPLMPKKGDGDDDDAAIVTPGIKSTGTKPT